MKATIFDLDGTLLHSMAADCEIFAASIRSILGSVTFRDSFGDYDNVTDRGIVEQLLSDNGMAVDPETVDSVRRRFVGGLSEHLQAFGPFSEIHGAKAFLDRLRGSCDARVAIATGCWRDSALLKLEASGFDLAGVPVATCDDSASRTDIMQVALARLGEPVDTVTYFGDAEWDARACRDLGWRFVPVGPDLDGLLTFDNFES